MSLIDDVTTIKLVTPSKRVMVTSNQNITQIVFYPNDPFMLIQKDGKWHRVKYEEAVK